MAILLWIYGCSWAILGAIYLFAVIKKRTAEVDRESIWFLLAVFLFAPIVVLCIPYILISGHIKNKKAKIRAAEYELREQQEKERRELAKKYYIELVANCDNLFNENYATLANSIHEGIESERYDDSLNQLFDEILPDGYKIDVDFCKDYGHGDESKLYIEMPDGVYDYDIFAHLQMDPSPKNVWKVYLIHTLWHVLPLWWHSNYNRRVFLFDIDDSLSRTMSFSNTSLAFLKESSLNITPEIFQKDNIFYVSSCYWNDWSGLVRECVKITFDGQKVVGIEDFHNEVLFEHKCGLRF